MCIRWNPHSQASHMHTNEVALVNMYIYGWTVPWTFGSHKDTAKPAWSCSFWHSSIPDLVCSHAWAYRWMLYKHCIKTCVEIIYITGHGPRTLLLLTWTICQQAHPIHNQSLGEACSTWGGWPFGIFWVWSLYPSTHQRLIPLRKLHFLAGSWPIRHWSATSWYTHSIKFRRTSNFQRFIENEILYAFSI